jgi:hypothetical protein
MGWAVGELRVAEHVKDAGKEGKETGKHEGASLESLRSRRGQTSMHQRLHGTAGAMSEATEHW